MKFYVIALISVLCISGCTYPYFKVENVGNKMLYNVKITSDKRSFDTGYLIPDAHKGYQGSFGLTSGNRVTVSWSEDGRNYQSREVRIRRFSDYSGEVTFRLDGKDVTVEY